MSQEKGNIDIRADLLGVPSSLLSDASHQAADSSAASNASRASSQHPRATTATGVSPSATTTGEERALLFLPPLLTQLEGLGPGQGSSSAQTLGASALWRVAVEEKRSAAPHGHPVGSQTQEGFVLGGRLRAAHELWMSVQKPSWRSR